MKTLCIINSSIDHKVVEQNIVVPVAQWLIWLHHKIIHIKSLQSSGAGRDASIHNRMCWLHMEIWKAGHYLCEYCSLSLVDVRQIGDDVLARETEVTQN